jgi:hypothetical protein
MSLFEILTKTTKLQNNKTKFTPKQMVSVFATKLIKFNLLIYYLLKNIFSFAI